MEFTWEDILERFNNNDLNVPKYFNDYETFFAILKKRGLMSEVDPKNAAGSEHWQNEYLLWLYNNDKENYYNWILELLGNEVTIENGIPYLEINDRSDLAKLFCDSNRNDLSKETIFSILRGDGDTWESHWDTTNDVYEDVIKELNPKNLNSLYERIIYELKDEEVSPETELLELIADEQGHPEYVIVTNENIVRIVDDEETMKYLLKEDLSDLSSDLYTVHSNSYNSAYENEVYDSIMSELKEYFDIDKAQWIYKPHPYKKETTIEYFKVPIFNFDDIINDYLINNKNYGNSGTIEYHGSLTYLIADDKECLSARAPDYPDFREINRNINEYFPDYI
jgi:hypothetical protein